MTRQMSTRTIRHARFETLEPRTLFDASPLGTPADARLIDFAGVQWVVKDSDEPVGPGPNYFSDATESVWVDGDGLHLKLRQEDGAWYSAEVYTVLPTTYGMHRFYMGGRPDLLDPNVVLGLFLHEDGGEELDIEFSRWSQDDPGFNSQFAVQPWDAPGNLNRFETGLNGDLSTHYLDWQSDAVTFKSFHAHSEEPHSDGHLIQEWQRAGAGIPSEDSGLRVHINLWSNASLPPTDLQEVEIIITDADLPNLTPVIGSLEVDAEWRIQGEQLTLAAIGAADADGSVTKVEFFRDANDDGLPQAEEMLGEDLNGADGWSWTALADWEPGEHTYFAQATDNLGVISAVATCDGTLVAPVDFTVVIGTGPNAQAKSVRYVEPDGTVCSVSLKGGTATLGFRREIPAVGDNGDEDELIIDTGGVSLVDITLSDTTSGSILNLKAKSGGDKLMHVGRITSETPVGKILARKTVLTGGGLWLTGPGAVKDLRLRGLADGADILLAGSAGGQGTTIHAVSAGEGSVIEVREGPLKKATFTGEFSGVLAAGVDKGDDGVWFTNDDSVVAAVSVGHVRLGKQRGDDHLAGDPRGLILGPETGKVTTGLPDKPNTGVCIDGVGFEAWVLGDATPTVAIDSVHGTSPKRRVSGQVTGVASDFYKVVLYAKTDHWYIQPDVGSALKLTGKGKWRTSKVDAGDLYAWLVRADVEPDNELWSPLTVDGTMVLAVDILAE